MSTLNLTEEAWTVLHCMLDLDGAGVYPSAARLVDRLPELPAPAVRAARRDVLASGMAAIQTPDDGDTLGDEDAGDDALADGPSRPVKVNTESREWNVALLRVVEGATGLYKNLSVLTGLTVNALKLRVTRARHDYPPDEMDEHTDTLSPSEQRYYERRFSRSDDPIVREWLLTQTPARRKHPDRCRFRETD